MTTTISKESAITIIEQAVRQQTLCDKLQMTLGADVEEYGIHLSTFFKALFNINIKDEYEAYADAFNKPLDLNIDYRNKAEMIHNNVVGLMTKEEIREESKDFNYNNVSWNLQGKLTACF